MQIMCLINRILYRFGMLWQVANMLDHNTEMGILR